MKNLKNLLIISIILCLCFPCVLYAQIGGGPISGGGGLNQSQVENVISQYNYAETVTVAKSGAKYSVIQDAIDSITDAASDKLYAVVVYPGTYTENVVMEEYVSLIGVGPKESIIVTSASGTTITAPPGASSPNNLGISNLTIQSTPTADGAECFEMGIGSVCISNCKIKMSSSTNGVNGKLVDHNGGTLKLKLCGLSYQMTGTSAGSESHFIIDIGGGGTDVCWIVNCIANIDVSDVDDIIVFYEEDTATTVESHINNNVVEMDLNSGTYSGFASFIYAHGAGTVKNVVGNSVRITSAGNGTGYFCYMDTTANNGVVNLVGNRINVTGFASNYSCNVFAGDTVNCWFNSITAADGATGAGTNNAVCSYNAGDVTATGTVQGEQLTSTDDATITDDLSVGGDATVTGSATVETNLVVGGSTWGAVISEQFKNEHAYQWLDNLTTPIGVWLMGQSASVTVTGSEYYNTATKISHAGTLTGGLTFATDRSYKGFCYSTLFNGTTDYIDFGDHADFSMNVAGTDRAYSVCAVINVVDSAPLKDIITKYDYTTGTPLKEWLIQITDTENLNFIVYDQSTTGYCIKKTDAALSVGWHFITVTYDGGGGASALDGADCVMYVDGVEVAASTTNSGTYANMEDLDCSLWIGASKSTAGAPQQFYNSYISGVVLTAEELSAATIYKMWRAVKAKYAL